MDLETKIRELNSHIHFLESKRPERQPTHSDATRATEIDNLRRNLQVAERAVVQASLH
jgi:hypothetical protein